MAQYGKFTPYLQLSTLPDYSDNTLQALGSEEFTPTKLIEDTNRTLTPDGTNTAGHAYLIYDIGSWTSVDYAIIYNRPTSAQAVYVLFQPEDATDFQYVTIHPGKFQVFSNMVPEANSLIGSLTGLTGSFAVSNFDYTAVGQNTALDIYVVGT